MDISAPRPATAQEALALRYGADAIPAAGPWNDHIALLLSHRSVRGYRPDALPEGTLDDWVERAYDDVPPRMWPVAKRSLLAHVQRIESLSAGV